MLACRATECWDPPSHACIIISSVSHPVSIPYQIKPRLASVVSASMPRVRRPSQQSILQRPREYALLQQLNHSPGDGTVELQELQALVGTYGNSGAQTSIADDLSFEEFAALFARPSTTADTGEGNCIGYAAFDTSGHLKPWRFNRRDLGALDVRIQITHVGVCHSDIHQARNDWKSTTYPIVPGHEIAGIVTEVGLEVTKFKVGERVGVGCMARSCLQPACKACTVMKEEQYCSARISTYNRKDIDGTMTYGGYSTHVLIHEAFVLRIPPSLPLHQAAPLLCAGITVYSPIKRFGLDKPGMRVGVVGLGGLGHVAVKVLKSLGVHVTVISTSPQKRDSALAALGADAFLLSTDAEQMKAAQGSLQGIISTVSDKHDMAALVMLMEVDSTLVYVGAPAESPTFPSIAMLFRRARVVGSLYGGIQETQEMLDFCAERGITCDTEVIPIAYVNEAFERVVNKDVAYRFVIDIQGSLIL